MTADRAHKCPVHPHIDAMTKRHSGIILPSLLLQDNITVPILLVSKFCCAVAKLTVDELLDGAFLEQGMPASTKADTGDAVGHGDVKGGTPTLCSQMHDLCMIKGSSTRCCRHNTA